MWSDVKTEREEEGAEVAPLVYRPAPGWNSANGGGGPSRIVAAEGFAGVGLAVVPSFAIEDETQARQKQLREQGFREGLAKGHAEAEVAIQQQRELIARAMVEFAKEREKYFHQVEGEVVALALAIVRKILRREAQTDPLLLAGLVRVALEKMAGSQNVRLRVHPAQIPVWQELFSKQTDFPLVPELSGDASLAPNQCQLETQHEVTDLNLETQLKEIEQGLLDLLAQRPEPK